MARDVVVPPRGRVCRALDFGLAPLDRTSRGLDPLGAPVGRTCRAPSPVAQLRGRTCRALGPVARQRGRSCGAPGRAFRQRGRTSKTWRGPVVRQRGWPDPRRAAERAPRVAGAGRARARRWSRGRQPHREPLAAAVHCSVGRRTAGGGRRGRAGEGGSGGGLTVRRLGRRRARRARPGTRRLRGGRSNHFRSFASGRRGLASRRFRALVERSCATIARGRSR